jgi:type III secretory pathway component EscT
VRTIVLSFSTSKVGQNFTKLLELGTASGPFLIQRAESHLQLMVNFSHGSALSLSLSDSFFCILILSLSPSELID